MQTVFFIPYSKVSLNNIAGKCGHGCTPSPFYSLTTVFRWFLAPSGTPSTASTRTAASRSEFAAPRLIQTKGQVGKFFPGMFLLTNSSQTTLPPVPTPSDHLFSQNCITLCAYSLYLCSTGHLASHCLVYLWLSVLGLRESIVSLSPSLVHLAISLTHTYPCSFSFFPDISFCVTTNLFILIYSYFFSSFHTPVNYCYYLHVILLFFSFFFFRSLTHSLHLSFGLSDPEQSVQELVYDLRSQCDAIRVTKTVRPYRMVICPVNENNAALMVSDGRVMLWELKAHTGRAVANPRYK